MQPLIKWAGGKQKLLAQIMPHVPKDFDTYYEPFFGGGAVFFALEPTKAVLTDINSELINFYEMVRDELPFLISEIDTYENTEEFYYRKRELDRSVEYRSLTNIQRAARFLYLNKTCFNGLYRVNKEGYFNTPFGKYKNPKFYDKDRIKKAFHLFNSPNNIEIRYGDLSEAKNASSDDFVYFDPPYVPLTKTSSFTAYTKYDFGTKKQIELRDICNILHQRGVKFLLSNSYCDFVLDLYRDYDILEIQARRFINSNGNKRGPIKEVLVRNF